MFKTVAVFVLALGAAQAGTVFSDDLFYVNGSGTQDNFDVTSLSGIMLNSPASGWSITLDLNTNLVGKNPYTFSEPLDFSADFEATCTKLAGCSALNLSVGATFDDIVFDGGNPLTWSVSLFGFGPSGNTSFQFGIPGVKVITASVDGPDYDFSDSGNFNKAGITTNGTANLTLGIKFTLPAAGENSSVTIPPDSTIDFEINSTNPVPEPVEGFGAGLALAGIAAWRMRRARR